MKNQYLNTGRKSDNNLQSSRKSVGLRSYKPFINVINRQQTRGIQYSQPTTRRDKLDQQINLHDCDFDADNVLNERLNRQTNDKIFNIIMKKKKQEISDDSNSISEKTVTSRLAPTEQELEGIGFVFQCPKCMNDLSIYDKKCFACNQQNAYYEKYSENISKSVWFCGNIECESLNFLPETDCRNCGTSSPIALELLNNLDAFIEFREKRDQKKLQQTFSKQNR